MLYGFRWIGKAWKFVVTHSKHYENLAEKLAESRREYKRLESGVGVDGLRQDYEQACSELEQSKTFLEQTGLELDDARIIARQEKTLRRLADERYEVAAKENSTFKDKLAVSIPLSAVGNMLQFSQSAALYANSDDCILFANREALTQIQRQGIKAQITGGNLWELTSASFMKRLKQDIDSRDSGFKIDYPGPFHCWYVGVARDDTNQLYGYFISNERGLIGKVLSTLLPEGVFEKTFKEARALLVPGRLSRELGRG